MENNLPKRKHPRLKNYDYSSVAAYFITICTQGRRKILSDIAENNSPLTVSDHIKKYGNYSVIYTEYGKIAERELLSLEERYPYLEIAQYVIMPNHIHAILFLRRETAGASPRPTVMDIICTFKSLTAKKCKVNGLPDKMFQTSFYDHVIRNKDDYDETVKYIHENPMNWYYDELYIDEL